jgi:hypothetical protein
MPDPNVAPDPQSLLLLNDVPIDAAEVTGSLRADPDDADLHDDVPLPGSVSGRRIIRLKTAGDRFQPPELSPSGLFSSLGFHRETHDAEWRYDPKRVLEWFVAHLRQIPPSEYSWVQAPWTLPEPSSGPPEPSQPQADANPQPRERDEIPRPSPGSSYPGNRPVIK